jgi:ATP-dependent RNA helicase DDX3X
MSEWETAVADLNIKGEGNEQDGALRDIGNTANNANFKKFTKDDFEKAGWAKPMKYDYASFEKGKGVKSEGQNDTENAVVQSEEPREEPKEESTANPDVLNEWLTTQEAGWAANAARYEWKDEYGDVGPRVPELEERLFRDEHILRKGNCFDALTLSVTQESVKLVRPIPSVC